MSTYSYLKTLQNYNCDSDCDNCVLCSKNNSYNVSCASLSEEQLKEIAYRNDTKKNVLITNEIEKNLRSDKMSTYSQLKALQNYDCDNNFDCNECALCSKNNGYNVCCSLLSEEQIKEIANKIDEKEKLLLLPAEEAPLNEEEISSKEKYKQFDKKPFRWKDFKYNIRVLINPDASYRPIMSKMEFGGIPLTKLYTNCIIENINGYGIGMLWITTEDGALLYVPWDMIVSIQPIGEKE